MRLDNRKYNQLRPIKIKPDFVKNSMGSVLISLGKTQVICTANSDETVPSWIKEQEEIKGWVTAEYSMLPGSCSPRFKREREKIKGRTLEIERLIGRSLRSIINLKKLGKRTITLDCDVINADGGTRCISICGSYIALVICIQKLLKKGYLKNNPIIGQVAAISVGLKKGQPYIDLCYEEDSQIDVDMNIVMTQEKKLIEIQATAEHKNFSIEEMQLMISLAQEGLKEIFELQNSACK